MSQTSLKQLGEEIKTNEAIANSDPGTEPNTRRMRLGNISQAKQKLQGLKLEYRKNILANAIFVVVTGSGAEKYASVAEKKFDCFSVNVEDFYKNLIKNVPKALYENKVVSGNLLEHISSNMEERARDLNIVSYPSIIMESKYKKLIKDEADLLKLAKTVINDKIGSEIVGLDATEKIVQRLLNSDLSGKKVPIILLVEDDSIVEDIAKGLKRSLTRRTFIVSTGEEVNEKMKNISFEVVEKITSKSVEESLVSLNKSLV